MDITLDKKGSTEASIKIKLNEADYQPKIEEKVKEYRRKANIKGFRPGKAPAGLIKKMYGKAILVEEINQLISESLPKYIKDNNLNILGEPLPVDNKEESIDWDSQKEFEFAYDIGFVNDFAYDISDKVELTRNKITATDKEIDQEVDYLRNQFGERSNPETVEEDDFVNGVLREKDAEKHFHVYLKPAELSKKAAKQFIGLKKDDEITVDIEKLYDDKKKLAENLRVGEDEAAELKGDFTFKVEQINRIVMAEVNQEFFDKLFGPDQVKTEEELRQKIEESLKQNFDNESENLLNRDIRNKLMENTQFEMPDEFLKRWLLATNDGKITLEEIEKDYDEFAKETKWSLISNKITKDNELKVEPEKVREIAIQQLEAQVGQPGILSQLGDQANSILQDYMSKNYMKIYNQAQDQKVLESIKEKITIKEKEVSFDEFKDLIRN